MQQDREALPYTWRNPGSTNFLLI